MSSRCSSASYSIGGSLIACTFSLLACGASSSETSRAAPSNESPAVAPLATDPEAPASEPVASSEGPTDPSDAPSETGVSMETPVQVCRGGERIELTYVVMPQNAGGAIGDMVARNGSSYFRINGDCSYWALAGGDRAPVYSGSLTAEQAAELSVSLRMAAWPQWYGVFISANIFDVSANVLISPNGEFACMAGCQSPLNPNDVALAQELAPVFAQAEAWLDRLVLEGEPLDGPVRVLGRTSGNKREHFLEGVINEQWLGERALSDFVFDDQQTAPPSGVLVDGADADYLRRLRTEAEARYRAAPNTLGGLIVIADGEALIELYVSDALPIEDASGVVPRR